MNGGEHLSMLHSSGRHVMVNLKRGSVKQGQHNLTVAKPDAAYNSDGTVREGRGPFRGQYGVNYRGPSCCSE